jgi:ubiquinone/menaquinone biosynthesis C-methylase UbiE
MTDVVRDPDGLELGHLRELANPARAKVLEIGCGDGRLVWQYGHDASRVYGVDTNPDKLKRALDGRPLALAPNTHFNLSLAEALPFADDSFDLAIFGWSL